MPLFEKIELEPIEPDDVHSLPQSSRQWGNEPLIIQYKGFVKAILLVFALFTVPLIQAFIGEGLVFEFCVVAGTVTGVWYLASCLLTRTITFFPDRIVRQGYFWQIVLPAKELEMVTDEQKVRFFHGTDKNIRESIVIRRVMTSGEEIADIVKYAADVYRISVKTGNAAKSRPNNLVLGKYQKAVSSYWSMVVFLVVFALIAFFTAGITENFSGLAPGLPAFPIRLAAIGAAVLAYLLLRKLSPSPPQESDQRAVPMETRLNKAENASFASSAVACAVTFIGLGIFFLFGNMFDFYLFLLVGVFYFYDFFPRLSDWEGQLQPRKAEEAATTAVVVPRRSLQVSLVLMGALAVSSYGESSHYLYSNRQDCLNDWGDGKDCQEAPAGTTTSYGTRYYYGPRYGTGGTRPIRSVGVATVSRGGFGSIGSFHASFGG